VTLRAAAGRGIMGAAASIPDRPAPRIKRRGPGLIGASYPVDRDFIATSFQLHRNFIAARDQPTDFIGIESVFARLVA
jgi:hypothetical protein